MSAIDDTRKLLQDMISPDLKALDARVKALEEKMDLRFMHVDEKFKSFEEKMDLKFDLVHATMAANHQSLMNAIDISRRVERLEAERDENKRLDRPS